MEKFHEEKKFAIRSGHILMLCSMAVVLLNLFIHTSVSAQQKIQKDERLGVLISFGAPGFGQIYAGNTWRGIGIAAAEAVCFGVVASMAEPRKVIVTSVGGDDYEVITTKSKKLSRGEVAVAVTAGVTGVGIYIWQLFDARNCVSKHNKAQGFDVGMTIMDNGRPGVNMSMNF